MISSNQNFSGQNNSFNKATPNSYPTQNPYPHPFFSHNYTQNTANSNTSTSNYYQKPNLTQQNRPVTGYNPFDQKQSESPKPYSPFNQEELEDNPFKKKIEVTNFEFDEDISELTPSPNSQNSTNQTQFSVLNNHSEMKSTQPIFTTSANFPVNDDYNFYQQSRKLQNHTQRSTTIDPQPKLTESNINLTTKPQSYQLFQQAPSPEIHQSTPEQNLIMSQSMSETSQFSKINYTENNYQTFPPVTTFSQVRPFEQKPSSEEPIEEYNTTSKQRKKKKEKNRTGINFLVTFLILILTAGIGTLGYISFAFYNQINDLKEKNLVLREEVKIAPDVRLQNLINKYEKEIDDLKEDLLLAKQKIEELGGDASVITVTQKQISLEDAQFIVVSIFPDSTVVNSSKTDNNLWKISLVTKTNQKLDVFLDNQGKIVLIELLEQN